MGFAALVVLALHASSASASASASGHSASRSDAEADRTLLRDAPIAGVGTVYLDSSTTQGMHWSAAAPHSPTITATVPGDLLTDLERAGAPCGPQITLS